jgi:hypothetical protein
MIALAFLGTTEYNNSKGLLFKMTFSGDYGVQGTGDLLNLLPTQNNGADGGITDPKAAYDQPLAQVPSIPPDAVQEELGGYYCQIQPNANPTLQNYGVRVFAAEGEELTTAEAYPAAVTGGSASLLIFLPAQ